MELLQKLNDEQKKAVCHTEGPLLVLAGAGSGKTRVIAYRFAYLLSEKGADDHELLGITFTNKAAKEMKARVHQLVGYRSKLWISTIHALGVQILRYAIKSDADAGVTSSFTIYDAQDQLGLIKEVIGELNFDHRLNKPRVFRAAISNVKNDLITPEDYEHRAVDFFSQRVAMVYSLYQKKMKANNAFDFDDLLFQTVKMLQDNKQLLTYYQRRFRYIMVDEYQDTNYAQYEMIRMLSEHHRNICVVGDDDQSIYRFRGADIRNILEFEDDYPEATVIKLEENYRSTSRILDAAFHIVKKNQKRKEKKLWTRNETGEKLKVYAADNHYDEAEFVTRVIEENGAADGPYAVLYRTNVQSRVFEEAFLQKNISYDIYGGLRFYERREIKDLLAYLRLLVNPADDVSFRRIVNVPRRGIGKQTLSKLEDFAAERFSSLFNALAHLDVGIFSLQQRNLLSRFAALITDLMTLKDCLSLQELVKAVLEKSGYRAILEAEGTEEAQNRIENLDEFISLTTGYLQSGGDHNLDLFLQQIALMTDLDTAQEGQPQVTLLTLHSAKGLEFPTVFIVGMEEGTFPHSRSLDSEEDLAEERRLCYVGITRAKHNLYLTHAHNRTIFGENLDRIPSRFIAEIPEEHFQEASDFTVKKETVDLLNENEWQAGDRVLHQYFGRGEIVGFRHSKEDTILQIRFPQGMKEILSGYASLQKV